MRIRGWQRPAAFSDTAEAYQATMAPALRPVAAEVVRRAALQPGERILDVGTGTGNAAALAIGQGRRVVGLDAAPAMLDLARGTVRGAEFVGGDFVDLPFEDSSFDVVLAVHALLFADDRVAALRGWRRVTGPGGRMALSVPGPGDVVPTAVLGHVYERYGIHWGREYPSEAELAGWATDAGWTEVATAADPTRFIPLEDEARFRTWLRTGARGRATAGWSPERRDEFARDLMAASPRTPQGGYRLPFGALYLTARR